MNSHFWKLRSGLAISVLASVSALASAQAAKPPGSEHASAHLPSAPAPDFALPSLTGETIHLSQFRGKVVVLNFWATWCVPCKLQIPWLVEFQDRYGPEGLQVLGISIDEEATRVEVGEHADKLRMNYPVLVDDGRAAKICGGVPAIPASFVISEDGNIIEAIVGLNSKDKIEHEIKKALADRDGTHPALTEKP